MKNEKFFINTEVDENTLSIPFIKMDLKNVKPKPVPTTPEEFLMSVILERQNIQEVTKCDKDYTKYKRNQSRFFDEIILTPSPESLKPTKEWQNIQVADFSEIRKYMSRMLKLKPPEGKHIKKFHIGKDNRTQWQQFFSDNDPALSCVLGFNAIQVDWGLEMLTLALKDVEAGATINQKTGRWIYAFLSCLKQPLLSESISIIRDITRECAKIRSCLDPDSENAKQKAAPLNLIICIVGHYFRQFDLADQLE